MHRFFILSNTKNQPSNQNDGCVYNEENESAEQFIDIVNAEDIKHISKVLRLQIGDNIEIVDKDSKLYLCEITEFSQDKVICKIIHQIMTDGESNIQINLYQGLPKGEKFDLIIQKCVELGVDKITPVLFDRCVVKWNDKSADKKLARWNRIAYEAAKQSKRCVIPVVEEPINIKELAQRIDTVNFSESANKKLVKNENINNNNTNSDNTNIHYVENDNHNLSIVFYEDEQKSRLKDIVDRFGGIKTINIIIGSEGGFEPQEIEILTEAGAISASLGSRILRTETAGIAACAVIQYSLGDLG